MLLLGLTLIVSAFVLVEGPRGVDQHWYLADVGAIASGAERKSNTVFAGLLLRGGTSVDGTAFVHNGPWMHAMALASRVSGLEVFPLWLGSNLLLHLLTALLVRSMATRLAGPAIGWLAYTAQLLAPVALWQAINVFQDTLFCFLIAVVLWSVVSTRPRVLRRAAGAAALLSGSLAHPLFVLLGLVWCALLQRREPHYTTLVPMLLLLGLCGWFAQDWFPSSFPPDLAAIVGAAIPHGSNMSWHLAELPAPVSWQLLLDKLVDAGRAQFAVPGFLPFTLPTSVGIVALLALARRQRREGVVDWWVLCAALFGMHLAIAVLLQNLPRYHLMSLPAAVLCVAASPLLRRWERRRIVAAGALLLVAGTLSSAVLFERARASHAAQQRVVEAVMTRLGPLPAGARAAFVAERAADSLVPLTTRIAPHPALLLDSRLLNAEQTEHALRQFAPDYLIDDGSIGTYAGEALGTTARDGTYPALRITRLAAGALER